MDRLPATLYHATPPGNVQSILRHGLVPQDERQTAHSDGVHLNRVFLSRFDDPSYMNLPADKIADAVLLSVDTSFIDPSKLYPDDSIYAAYFNGQLVDEEIADMLPSHYCKWGSSGSAIDFGDWMDDADNGPSDDELERLLAGRFGLTLWGSTEILELGEVGYEGRIPPEAISLHANPGHRASTPEYGVDLDPNDNGGVSMSVVDSASEHARLRLAGTYYDFGHDPGEVDFWQFDGERLQVVRAMGFDNHEALFPSGSTIAHGRVVGDAGTAAFFAGDSSEQQHAVEALIDRFPDTRFTVWADGVWTRESMTLQQFWQSLSRSASREPAFLDKLRDAGALPPPETASAALAAVMSGTLIHNAVGSAGGDPEEKVRSILESGIDPSRWVRPAPGQGWSDHPKAAYLSLAWDGAIENPPSNYVFAEPRLSNPLVLWCFDADGNYVWGEALRKATGKSGQALSSLLRRHGYDSVVTVHQNGDIGEIAYFGESPLPAFLPERDDRIAHALAVAAKTTRRAALGDIFRGVQTVIDKYGGKGLFARFSDVPKVGIRPSTEHHDPYGVYFYPVDWLAENAGWGTTYVNLPYITVARIRRSGWLNLATVRPAKARELAEKGGVLEEYDARTSGKGLNQAKGGRAGKRLWDAVEDKVKPFESESNKMEWNRIFGRMGVKAIYDPGTGTVNDREPSQIVVLDLSLIEVVDMVENKEDRKSVFHAVLKAVADDVLDGGWRVAGSHSEGGIWATGEVSGAPVELSVMPARGGFKVEVALSYHDSSGKKRRIVSKGEMPSEWEYASAAYLSAQHAKSIKRTLGDAELGAGGTEDAEDMLDAALRAFTNLRLPDLTVKDEGEGVSFWKNTGDGKIEGSLKANGDRRELEMYAEDWLQFAGDDSSVIEVGPMRISWEGDPSSAKAGMVAELSRAVQELRVTDGEGKLNEDINRGAAEEILRMRMLGWMFPEDILDAAGLPKKKKTATAECPYGEYRTYTPSPGGVRMPPRITPKVHGDVQELFSGACVCDRCQTDASGSPRVAKAISAAISGLGCRSTRKPRNAAQRPPTGLQRPLDAQHSTNDAYLPLIRESGGSEREMTTPFGKLPGAVRSDITENLHDAFFAGTDVSHEILRDVLVDMDTPLAVGRLSVAALAKQAPLVSPAAAAGLAEALRRSGDLDPILTDGDRLYDGGHRLSAYAAEGRDTIPTVDISPLLAVDWETEFCEEIPGLDIVGLGRTTTARAAAVEAWHGTKNTDFKEFDMAFAHSELGFHFGTKDQAEGLLGEDMTVPRVIRVELDIENPLRMPDIGEWQGYSAKAEFERVLGEAIPGSGRPASIVRAVTDAGYDSIVYENRFEGEGDSYIVFDKSRIRIVEDRRALAPATEAEPVAGKPRFVTLDEMGEMSRIPEAEALSRAARALGEFGDTVSATADAKYPRAADAVDGRRVLPEVPNVSSISASFGDWEELPGIREMSMSDFGGPRTVFYAADDFRRSRELAGRIRESGEISPLIVAVDDDGPYILEGGHRFVALHELGARSFPALVVIDKDEPPDPDSGATPLASAFSRAARALGEHLGDTMSAYRALGAEHMEKVIREGFTGEHHRHGVYYTANLERAMFYARFMPAVGRRTGRWGVVFELEADTSRSTADVNDATEAQTDELFEEVRQAAGDMVEMIHRNSDIQLVDLDAARQLESWLGGLTVSEGFYESPEQHSVWQLLADETDMTVAEAKEALPPGKYGEMTVLDGRGVAGINVGEIEGQAQAVSSAGIGPERLTAVWLPSGLLEAAGETIPAGADTMSDHVDVIPAQLDAEADDHFRHEVGRQRDEAKGRYEGDPPEGMATDDEEAWYSEQEEVAEAMDDILERWESERDSTMPGHIYSKIFKGESVTPADLDREERLVRYPLPGGRLAATKAVRKALATSGQGAGSKAAAGEHVSPMEQALVSRRVRGDELLDALDLAEELTNAGAEISPAGVVTLYHRTDQGSAEEIARTGRILSREDRLFFGTNPDGEQISGHGEAVVRVHLPLEKLELQAVMPGEAFVTMMSGGRPVTVDAEVVDADRRTVGYRGRAARRAAEQTMEGASMRREDAIAGALQRAAETMADWSEESDVDPESFEDEGFVSDESGHTFWGSKGSGCLFVRNHPDEGSQLLAVLRSPQVEEPNTWGTTGGAVPQGETNDFASAIRETREEVGSIPRYKGVKKYVWKAKGGTFTYTTFILECLDMDWLPGTFNWEATDARWVSLDEASSLDLHFGLVAILNDLGEGIFPAGE